MSTAPKYKRFSWIPGGVMCACGHRYPILSQKSAFSDNIKYYETSVCPVCKRSDVAPEERDAEIKKIWDQSGNSPRIESEA